VIGYGKDGLSGIPGVHPASYTMGNGVNSLGVKVVPNTEVKNGGVITPLPQHIFMV
jgi:hypothetical protein